MKWKHPPSIKIYEALGSIADQRIEIFENSAKIFSSSGNKFYTVSHDPSAKSIMVNDNASFYKGYLGYPAIAFLMMVGEIKYSPSVAEKLKDIAWKDINTKFKNDFEKTLAYVLEGKTHEDKIEIQEDIKKINEQLLTKSYSFLGKKVRPPEGY